MRGEKRHGAGDDLVQFERLRELREREVDHVRVCRGDLQKGLAAEDDDLARPSQGVSLSAVGCRMDGGGSEEKKHTTANKYTEITASFASRKSNNLAMSPYPWTSCAYIVSMPANAKKCCCRKRKWYASSGSVALKTAGSSCRWLMAAAREGSMKSRIRSSDRRVTARSASEGSRTSRKT